MADLSGRLRLRCDGLGATRPPQTLGDPGAVKPDTCPCPCTPAYTTMLMHDPDWGHWGPTESSRRSAATALTRTQWQPHARWGQVGASDWNTVRPEHCTPDHYAPTCRE